MVDRPDVSLGIRRTASGVVLVDRSCGDCAACAAGAPLWCTRPDPEGRDLTAVFAAERADVLVAALTAAAALAEAPATSTVLVVGDEDGPLATLVRALVPTRVLVSPDPFAATTKAALGDLEPSGRAPVVVAGTDARAAVKAVRRGGHVCVGLPDARMPSVTELVQREVTLVGPRDVAGTVRRLGEPAWAAAVSAAA
jgi:hypothetical protein